VNACTIIARNYLAQARVLEESFREHHPGETFTTLILDPLESSAAGQTFRIFRGRDIGIDEAEYHRMAAIYDVMQLATAVKPWFMRTLLEEAREPVLYLDPDIQIFAPLDELGELAREHSIVLTPHQVRPRDYDPENVADTSVQLAGVFNLGFLGLGPDTDDFLEWWCGRLARDSIVAPERGIFVDQRWLDLVPAQFEHFIVRDPAVNVAWWNLQDRAFRSKGQGWEVDGDALKFFHFSGYDPRKPHLLSKFQGPKPRILLSEHPDLARICAQYAERLFANGFKAAIAQSYGFDSLANGVPYDPRMRRLYRSELLRAEEAGDPEPPNPFSSPDEFLAWLREPLDDAGQARRISRYLYQLYAERPDLQSRFHDIRWLAGDGYVEWAATEGRFEESIPVELVPETTPVDVAEAEGEPESEPEPRVAIPRGVNVAGYFRAEAGVGEAGRQILAAVREAGIPFSTHTYEATISRQGHESPPEERPAPEYDTNLICVNADQLPRFTWDAGPSFFQDRYSIGVWWWEVAEFPEWLHPAFEIVREIWVGSRHVADAIAAQTEQPVLVFPLPIDLPRAPDLSRAELGLPDQFLFLFSFDFLSVVERKNPLGLVEAFRAAFGPGEGPVLVIKSINGDKKLIELEQLRAAATGRPDIYVLDRYLSAPEKNGLMSTADCYVSLHRSEGFGLTLAESMAYGKPVIATAFSGNLEFMNEDNSYLVPFETVEIGPGAAPYPEDGTWANPNLDRAAELMRFVYESPDEARRKGEQARLEIRENRSVERAAGFVKSRFHEIEELREQPAATHIPEAPALSTSPEIEHAHAFLSEGPSVPLRSPSRFGAFGVLARRLLFRVLRPYMIRQREWEVAVVEALRQVEEEARAHARARAHEAEQHSTDLVTKATGSLERTLRTHERVHTEALDALREVEERALSEAHSVEQRALSEAHEVEQRALSEAQEVEQRSTDRVSEAMKSLELRQRAYESAATGYTERLEALEAMRQSLDALEESLFAQPYVSDPNALVTTDENGRVMIGYTSGSSSRKADLYRGFEDVFRGSEGFIRSRQEKYIDLLRDHAPVIDIGCGRGELLDLLVGAGIDAKGIDVDEGMVARSREKGHDVEQAEATKYLEGLNDASVGAIAALQVIEHFSYSELLRFFELATSKLRPQGILLAETVNPHALNAFKTFSVDLTHQSPIFPEVAVVLCRLTGFDTAYVLFPNGSGDLEQDRRQQGEYAVVATRQ
jgi:glycosyltransferase involved in cell wall biosynthesis/2-polyprenyl-3-methyl-5-hydroxy-6-metoxy-1,4-benzoquinol methylase